MIERGQIYWCGLDPIQGHDQAPTRPVVIVSADSYNMTRSSLVAIVPLTKAPVKNPVHVGLTPEDTGLSLPSTALTDHARFVDRSRLRGIAVGRVSTAPMALLGRHLTRLFGL